MNFKKIIWTSIDLFLDNTFPHTVPALCMTDAVILGRHKYSLLANVPKPLDQDARTKKQVV